MVAAQAQLSQDDIHVLRAKLLSPSTTLAQKYRVLFALRNSSCRTSHEAMLLGEPAEHRASLYALAQGQWLIASALCSTSGHISPVQT